MPNRWLLPAALPLLSGRILAACAVALACGTSAAQGQGAVPPPLPSVLGTHPPAAAPGMAPQSCLVEPFQVSEIGSPAPGIVETIAVHRGDVVTEGQTLAVLNTRVDAATLKLRESEAAYLSRVTGRNAELYKRKLLPAGDYDEMTSRSRQAQLQVALQQAVLGERVIKSPYAGVVVERYVGQGDRVNDNKLLRIAQIDPLVVKVVLPERDYGRLKADDRAQVHVNPVIRAEPLAAAVWRIDRVLDAASGTFTVLLKVPNPGHAIPAGIRCTVAFGG